MFYITQSGQIYSGDPQNNDRKLTEEEVELIRIGRFIIVNNRVVDTSSQPGYSLNTRINEINSEIEELQKQLNNLDLKTIRPLREGGTLENGTTYLDYYQSQISELRVQLRELNTEKTALENELAELTEVHNDLSE